MRSNIEQVVQSSVTVANCANGHKGTTNHLPWKGSTICHMLSNTVMIQDCTKCFGKSTF